MNFVIAGGVFFVGAIVCLVLSVITLPPVSYDQAPLFTSDYSVSTGFVVGTVVMIVLSVISLVMAMDRD